MNPQEILDICDTKISDAMSIEQAEKNNRFISDSRNNAEKFERVIEVLLGAVEKVTAYFDTNPHYEHDCEYSSKLDDRMNTAKEAIAKAAEIVGEKK